MEGIGKAKKSPSSLVSGPRNSRIVLKERKRNPRKREMGFGEDHLAVPDELP